MPDPGLCDGKRSYSLATVANDDNRTLFAFELDRAKLPADVLNSDVTPVTCND